MWRTTNIFQLTTLFVILHCSLGRDDYYFERCEALDVPMCDSMPYNTTILPNLFGWDRQQFASEDMDDFKPLIDTGCHPHLRVFLCNIFAPVCTMLRRPLRPCRSFCQVIEARCSQLMIRMYFLPEWPYYLQCDHYPEEGKSLCIPNPSTAVNPYNETTGVSTEISTPDVPTIASSVTTENEHDGLTITTTYTPSTEADRAVRPSTSPTTQNATHPAMDTTKRRSNDVCQSIQIPMCQTGIPYNRTSLPNILKHVSQTEARSEIEKFKPVVDSGCFEDFQLFLCSVYVPVCTPLKEPIPPCFRLCSKSRKRCRRHIRKALGSRWPRTLNCKRFPKEGVCIQSAASFRPQMSFCDQH